MFKARSLIWALILLPWVSATHADPMRPDNYQLPQTNQAPSIVSEPSLVLSSIYILDDQRYAVINGQWLTLNDTIHNYRLTDIRPDHVHLRQGSRQRTLELRQAGSLSITETDEE